MFGICPLFISAMCKNICLFSLNFNRLFSNTQAKRFKTDRLAGQLLENMQYLKETNSSSSK